MIFRQQNPLQFESQINVPNKHDKSFEIIIYDLWIANYRFFVQNIFDLCQLLCEKIALKILFFTLFAWKSLRIDSNCMNLKKKGFYDVSHEIKWSEMFEKISYFDSIETRDFLLHGDLNKFYSNKNAVVLLFIHQFNSSTGKLTSNSLVILCEFSMILISYI